MSKDARQRRQLKRWGFEAVRHPLCPCGKVSFSKRDAQTKRNIARRVGRARFLRIYTCPDSNTWHLTSVLHKKDHED